MSLFTKVIAKVPRRNAFNLSNENHLTTEFGKLVPVMVKECLPGDKFKAHTEAVVKLAPLAAPTFSRIDVYFHYFYVPNRLVYTNWENFITSGIDGLSPDGDLDNGLVAPYFEFSELLQTGRLVDRSLCDYMGLPAADSTKTYSNVPPINAIPFLAYQKIYSDWFRDELLDSYEFEPVGDGKISAISQSNYLVLRARAWKKDYFTSARPDTQLGAPAQVKISGELVSNGPFRLKATQNQGTGIFLGKDVGAAAEYIDGYYYNNTVLADIEGNRVSGSTQYYGDGISLDGASIDINDLRYALKLQQWLEKNMRGGNRYIENIFHHFGVKSSDARLQRSQYLGGRKLPVTVGEMFQTVDTVDNTDYNDSTQPLGRRAGIGNAAGRSQTINFFAEEHGYFICLMSILPHASYMQGIPRHLGYRWSRFHYAWPEFGNIGEQEIKNWELYVAPDDETGAISNDSEFGYQSRYAEYKFGMNEIHGQFRSNLDFWHNGRKFSSQPKLNGRFVALDTQSLNDQNRIFTVVGISGEDHFYCHLFHDVKVLRMLPKYGIPSL